MKYVMSDLHGAADKYFEMMEKLKLTSQDTLYVLGDVIDRGPEPFSILKDMMSRPNVYPVLGNHEWVARDLLRMLLTEVSETSLESVQKEGKLLQLMLWMQNGGSVTIEDFRRLNPQEQVRMIKYLDGFRKYAVTFSGGRGFVLVHAGLQNFSEERPLGSYEIRELVEGRRDPSLRYFSSSDMFVVSGHTPNQFVNGKAEVIMQNNNIMIDCGAIFEGGRLAAVCLDTLETIYV